MTIGGVRPLINKPGFINPGLTLQSIGQQLLLIMADQSKLGYLGWHQLRRTPILKFVMATPAGATSVRRYLGEECAMSVLQNVGDELLEIGQYIYCMGPSIGGSTSIQFISYFGRENKDSRILQSIPT